MRYSLKLFILTLLTLLGLMFSLQNANAQPNNVLASSEVSKSEVPKIEKIMVVIFENTDYELAMKQPFFSKFSKDGASISNFYAETHPSQGNYIALISGSKHGVKDDQNINISANHIGDLLESKEKSWKVYAEDYPGNCFLGASKGQYVRKHVPFLSFVNIQKSPSRCSKIVNANEIESDISSNQLPNFSLYIPNMKNDGHDTGVTFADSWFRQRFSSLMANQNFSKNMLLVATFDESSHKGGNHIYTAFWGDYVKPGSIHTELSDHYSLLKTFEVALGLGNLGLNDANALPISGIWRPSPSLSH